MKDNARFYETICKQINALKSQYPIEKLCSSLDYSRFFTQANYIKKKINDGLLDEKQKIELLKSLDDYIKIVENYKAKKGLKPKTDRPPEQPSVLEEKIKIKEISPLQLSAEQAKYEPKGQNEARKRYYFLLGKIARLEACSREIVAGNFSVKDFYSLLNEIEEIFINSKLHSDDLNYLWKKYKSIKEGTKEFLRKESELARKNIEEIVDKALKEIEKGNLSYAKSLMFKTFDMYKNARLNKEDRSYCKSKIEDMKSRLNELTKEHKEKQEYYKKKALELLDEIKKNESNPYNLVETIKEIQLEMKIVGIKKGYKEINKILQEAWQIASEKIALEKQKRQETKIEKEIRRLEELNLRRLDFIEQTQKEIVALKATPFNPKIAEKEDFIKKLKEQVKETESKIRKLKRQLESS